jgi:hypothetical protein
MSAYAQALGAVRKILWREWDPIGCGVPADEYDDYAPEVVRLLLGGADREALAGYLRRTADDTLGCPVPEARLALVLDGLLGLELKVQAGERS